MADFTTLVLTIDAVAVPHNQIHGTILIGRRENEASTMRFTLIPPKGIQDLSSWAGKDVVLTIDAIIAFTGVIDIPEIDILGERITMICSDRRREVLNQEDVSGIGFYSRAIFSEADNNIDELDQRLTTVPESADILPDGTPAFTDLKAKAIPDITLLNADVYRRRPEVSVTSRGRLTNQVILNFKLRFTRNRQRQRNFQIGDNSFCDYVDTLGSHYTTKEEFYNYMTSGDWYVKEDTVYFEELPASGLIQYCQAADFFWYNFNSLLALWVTYTASLRFSQTITEDYSITVQAPQSITQYGLISWDQANGLEIKYDSDVWENQKTYTAPDGLTYDINDYYIDEDSQNDYSDAVVCAMNIANTKIIKSHIDTQVNFETDLRLDFDLTKTIELTTSLINAVGKISAVDHEISIPDRKGDTTTGISLGTSQGIVTPDALNAPTRIPVPVVGDVYPDPYFIPLAIDGSGNMITPAIDDLSRDEQIVTQADSYDVEIQNDLFEVTF